jgi:hypothetical protein
VAEILDTPLTRQKRRYETELAAKDEIIQTLRLQNNTVRGVNDLLKFELLSLETILTGMQKSFDQVKEHVRILKINLPEIDKAKE